MSFLSTSLNKIKPSPTIAVSQKAAELKAKGVDVIGLGMGEPDLNTPDNVKKAAIQAIENNFTRYTAVDGTIELKNAVVDKFSRDNYITYELNEVTVGSGAKQIIYNAFMATLNEGDEVIIPSPYWVSYPDMVLLAGGQPVIVEGRASNDFKITPQALEATITEKTKWLILNSPSNPTGSCYTIDEIRALADVLLKYEHVHILSDDIYEHLIFDGLEFATIAGVEPKLKNRVLTLNGVSKAYSMTGFRIGFAGGNATLIKAIATIQSQSTSNPCSISQKAAAEAISGEQGYLKDNAAIFEKRRDMVVGLLNKIEGIKCNVPNGAFYVFPSCEGLFGKKTLSGEAINNSTDFASFLLEEAKVAVVPGIAFGAEGFFRISYAASEDLLKDAIARIKDAVRILQ